MRNCSYKGGFAVFLVLVLAGAGLATPSTQIWNPSTDIQGTGTFHVGLDDYFTAEGPRDEGYAFPSDIGVTYGIFGNVEVGVDAFGATDSPIVFNAKFGLPEGEGLPAFAVGGFGFGTRPDETDMNVLYVVMARTFEMAGRMSVGYFSGNPKILVNDDGDEDNDGVIFTWDKAVSDRLWLCVDYAGSRSSLGAAFYGFSWLFDPDTSMIFGYGTFNNGAKPVFTAQVDINI